MSVRTPSVCYCCPHILQDANVYFDAADKVVVAAPLTAVRALFVSTEDPAIITNSRAEAERRTSWTLVYTDTPRGVGGAGAETREASVHLPPSSIQRLGVSTQQHLLNLLMALECDHWIGTRASNWNRLIDELRCIWVPKCRGAFIEVSCVVRICCIDLSCPWHYLRIPDQLSARSFKLRFAEQVNSDNGLLLLLLGHPRIFACDVQVSDNSNDYNWRRRQLRDK